MANLVKVFVHDDKGRGLSGHNIKYYNGDIVKTNKDGYASLILDGGGETEIYVNGFRIWKGYKSSAPKILTYQKG